MFVNHGLGRNLDPSEPSAVIYGLDRPGETSVDAGNLLDLAADLAHDTGAIERLGLTPAGKGKTGPIRLDGAATLGLDPPLGRQQPPLDDLAGILLLVLPQAGKRRLELHGALLDGDVMVLLVLLPDAVPLGRALGLVGSGAVLKREVALDDAQPDLARLALELGRVELDAAQLDGVVDLEEDVADILVGEVVAYAVKVADVLYAGCRGQVDEGFDWHCVSSCRGSCGGGGGGGGCDR